MIRFSLIAVALALPTSVAFAEMLANPVADLRAALPVCVQSLRTGDNPPVADGWRPAVHMSGTPYGIAAVRARNIPAALEAMAYRRQTFVLAQRHLTLTQYSYRGEYVACSISGDVTAATQAELAQTLTSGLERLSTTNDRLVELRRQYLLTNTTDTYRMDQFTLTIEPGSADNRNLFSLIVVKD